VHVRDQGMAKLHAEKGGQGIASFTPRLGRNQDPVAGTSCELHFAKSIDVQICRLFGQSCPLPIDIASSKSASCSIRGQKSDASAKSQGHMHLIASRICFASARRFLVACVMLTCLAWPVCSAPDEEQLGKSAGYPVATRETWFFDERVRVGSFSSTGCWRTTPSRRLPIRFRSLPPASERGSNIASKVGR
jgi:hypothetical protein